MPHIIGSPGYNRAHDLYLTPPEPPESEIEVPGFECDADLEDEGKGVGICDYAGDVFGEMDAGDLVIVCPKCGTETSVDPAVYFD